jgi:hypothetical protein
MIAIGPRPRPDHKLSFAIHNAERHASGAVHVVLLVGCFAEWLWWLLIVCCGTVDALSAAAVTTTQNSVAMTNFMNKLPFCVLRGCEQL